MATQIFEYAVMYRFQEGMERPTSVHRSKEAAIKKATRDSREHKCKFGNENAYVAISWNAGRNAKILVPDDISSCEIY